MDILKLATLHPTIVAAICLVTVAGFTLKIMTRDMGREVYEDWTDYQQDNE